MRLFLVLVSAILTAACDPAGAVIVDNQSDAEYVARTTGYDGNVRHQAVPAHSSVSVGENAVGSQEPAVSVDLLDAECVVVFSKALRDEPFPGGGIFTISEVGAITFDGGSPDTGPAAGPSTRCGPALVTPAPPK